MSAAPQDTPAAASHPQTAGDTDGPWAGFPLAAAAAVADLRSRFDQDLWLVSTIDPDADDQQVVAAARPWTEQAPPCVVLSWAESFCIRMVASRGPALEPDVQRSAVCSPPAARC
jgi:hypothetical protein